MLTNIATGVNSGARAVVAADFDGDRDDDVAVANATTGNVVLLRNNGVEGFGQESPAGDAGRRRAQRHRRRGLRRQRPARRRGGERVVEHRRGAAAQAGNDGFTTRPARRSRSAPAPSASPPPISTATAARTRRRDHGAGSPPLARLRRFRRRRSADPGDRANPWPPRTSTDFDPTSRSSAIARATDRFTCCSTRLLPSTPVPTHRTPRPAPAARRRKSVEVNLSGQGTVKVKLKGSNRMSTSREATHLKVGTRSRHAQGPVTIVAAAGRQDGDRRTSIDGLFMISQTKGAGTTLTLSEKLDCPKQSKARARPEAQDPQAVGRRQGQVPHQGQLQRGHRARHQVARHDTCTSTHDAGDAGRRQRRGLRQAQDAIRASGQALHGPQEALDRHAAPAAPCATSGTARRPPWGPASRSRRRRRARARPRRRV